MLQPRKDTMTVEAQVPVVDAQDVSSTQNARNAANLDALPTAQSFATICTTLPSVAANQNDVGGSQGEKGNVLAAHGGNGFHNMTLNVDGIAISTLGYHYQFRRGMVYVFAESRGRTGKCHSKQTPIPRSQPVAASGSLTRSRARAATRSTEPSLPTAPTLLCRGAMTTPT